MKKTAVYIGLAAGIIMIVFSIFIFEFDVSDCVGNYSSHYSYGGDAYTGIQNAAADTANNVRTAGEGLAKLIKLSFGFLVMSLGLFDICYFLLKNQETNTIIETKKETVVPNGQPIIKSEGDK